MYRSICILLVKFTYYALLEIDEVLQILTNMWQPVNDSVNLHSHERN